MLLQWPMKWIIPLASACLITGLRNELIYFFCLNSLMYLTQNMKGVAIISTRVYDLLTRKCQLFSAIPLYPAALCGRDTRRRTQTEVIPCQSTCSRVVEQLNRSQKNVFSVSSHSERVSLQRVPLVLTWATNVAHSVDLASATRPRVRLHLNSPAASPDVVEFEVLIEEFYFCHIRCKSTNVSEESICCRLQGRIIYKVRNQREVGSKYYLAYSSILKVEVLRSCEISIDVHRLHSLITYNRWLG